MWGLELFLTTRLPSKHVLTPQFCTLELTPLLSLHNETLTCKPSNFVGVAVATVVALRAWLW